MLQLLGKSLYDFAMLIILKLILDFDLMSEIALDFELQLFGNRVLGHHPPQHSEFALQRFAILANGRNNTPNFTDIIGQDN
jgi:hypothetical protein